MEKDLGVEVVTDVYLLYSGNHILSCVIMWHVADSAGSTPSYMIPSFMLWASTTSQLGITQVVALLDSSQPMGGILFVLPCLCLFVSGIADS